MSIVGFQSFWAVGSRAYFKRDNVGSTEQPWIDLGVLETASPALEAEKIELKDGDGGVRTLVDSAVTEIGEMYDLVCSNLNDRNLALMFLSDPPEAFTQAAALVELSNYCEAGQLTKILDADDVPVFMFSAICGVATSTYASTVDCTAIDASAKEITVDTDLSLVLADGDTIILCADGGMVDADNAGTYTCDGAPTATVITVNEDLSADETGITATVIHDSGSNNFAEADEFEVVSADRGLFKIGATSSLVAGDHTVIANTAAVTGDRLTKPQAQEGEAEGLMVLVWSGGGNAEQTARYARVGLSPSSADLKVDDYSNMTLQAQVISDPNATDEFGGLLHFKGSLPTGS